jgi:hypothetical protein
MRQRRRRAKEETPASYRQSVREARSERNDEDDGEKRVFLGKFDESAMRKTDFRLTYNPLNTASTSSFCCSTKYSFTPGATVAIAGLPAYSIFAPSGRIC